MTPQPPALLIVGAFPAADTTEATRLAGGVLQSCRALLESSLRSRARLSLVDSTQISVPPPAFTIRLMRAIRRMCVFLSTFQRARPDSVLIFASSGASFVEKSAYAWYSRARGAQVLFFMRDGGFMVWARDTRIAREIARLVLCPNSFVLCQTETWRRFFTLELRIPAPKCVVVENWTVRRQDLAIGDAREYRESGRITILFLGWIEESKGVPELLEAFRSVAARRPNDDLRLILAGHGSLLAQCRAWVADHNLESVIDFAGWVFAADKERALREADIFVLPSHFEGLPNALLEAMAAGLPVIATRVGGIPDIVEHGRHGLLLNPRDVRGLETAIDLLLNESRLRESMGRAARAHAERFEVERAVDSLLGLIWNSGRPSSVSDGAKRLS